MHYMHYKDYIHHDFYVYSPVLLTQYLGHCWHTPCTELYILRISAWLLRKPPSPATGGGNHLAGGGGVWGSLLIYTYYIYSVFDMPSIHVCSKWFLLQSCLDINVLYIASDRHCLKLCFHISNFKPTTSDNTRQGDCRRRFQSPDRGASCALRTGSFSPAGSTVWNHR